MSQLSLPLCNDQCSVMTYESYGKNQMPRDVYSSCMDPVHMANSDDLWMNSDNFRLMSRVTNSFSLDSLLADIVHLTNQKLNMMKKDSETEEENTMLLEEIKSKQSQIEEAEKQYQHAKKFKEEIFFSAKIEMNRLAMHMKQKEQKLTEKKRKERYQKALDSMKQDRQQDLQSGEEWWEGLTLIAFGQPLNEIAGCKRKRAENLMSHVTDEERIEARKNIFPLDEGEDSIVLIAVRQHEDKDDEEGEALFATKVASRHLEYKVDTSGSLEKVQICNLNEETMRVAPVYYCKYNNDTPEVEEVEEMLTLKAGETSFLPYPLILQEGEGEIETGWRLKTPAGDIIMQISFISQNAAGGVGISTAPIHPRSQFSKVLDVVDKKIVSHKLANMIFSEKFNVRRKSFHRRPIVGLGHRRNWRTGRTTRSAGNTRGSSVQENEHDIEMLDTSKEDAFLKSIEGNYWCLIPSYQADGSPYRGDLQPIPLQMVASDFNIPYHETVPEHFNQTVSRAVVLKGEVVDGIQYQLAINVSDDNPLNGTEIESFILTTTEMAMIFLEDMNGFIKNMPGPLNFNKGHGATTFKGKEYQVLGYYAPPNKSLQYTNFDQNRTITFKTNETMKMRLVDNDNENKMILDNDGPVRHAQGGRASVSYERWNNDVTAIMKGEIVVVNIKTPAMKPIIAYGSNECPSCFEEQSVMLVQRPCGHKICEDCYVQWQRASFGRTKCMLCRTLVTGCNKVNVASNEPGSGTGNL